MTRLVLLAALLGCGNRPPPQGRPIAADPAAAARANVDRLCSDCHGGGAEGAPDLTAIGTDRFLAARAAQMVGAHRMPPRGELDAATRRELVTQLCGLATPQAATCVAHMLFEPPPVTRSASEILADLDAIAPAPPGARPSSSVRQLAGFDAPVVHASVTIQSLLALIAAERCPAATFATCAARILSLELQTLPPLPALPLPPLPLPPPPGRQEPK